MFNKPPLKDSISNYSHGKKISLDRARLVPENTPEKITSPVSNYNDLEIDQIRKKISGESNISPELQEKIKNDEMFKKYSIAMFFPIIGDRIIAGEHVEVSPVKTTTRPGGLKVVFDDKSYVIKSLENKNESDVARIASDIGVGPRQFESINGNLTEEWIEGDLIAKLNPEQCTPEYMEELGVKIGSAIKKLHDKNIVINDQLLRDDFGKSHILVNANHEVTFIDFGASVDLSKFPDLTDDQTYSLMYSDPFARMSLGNVEDSNQTQNAIRDYKKYLLDTYTTKEELIQGIDFQRLGEGLHFLGYELPNIGSLQNGIRTGLV